MEKILKLFFLSSYQTLDWGYCVLQTRLGTNDAPLRSSRLSLCLGEGNGDTVRQKHRNTLSLSIYNIFFQSLTTYITIAISYIFT